jgi:hypothetical protein
MNDRTLAVHGNRTGMGTSKAWNTASKTFYLGKIGNNTSYKSM